MKVCIKRNNEQVELMRYSKTVDFIHVLVCEPMDSMQYRPPNANHEFSSFRKQTILASTKCMPSVNKLDISLGVMMYLNLSSERWHLRFAFVLVWTNTPIFYSSI